MYQNIHISFSILLLFHPIPQNYYTHTQTYTHTHTQTHALSLSRVEREREEMEDMMGRVFQVSNQFLNR